jgi:hypothetical protein
MGQVSKRKPSPFSHPLRIDQEVEGRLNFLASLRVPGIVVEQLPATNVDAQLQK